MRRPDIAFLNTADALDQGYNPRTVAIWLRTYAHLIQNDQPTEPARELEPSTAGDPE